MATLFRPRLAPSLRPHTRAFTTTPTLPISLQLEKNDPDLVADTLPPYPHGPTRWYKQSSLGLYGGTRIRFGNNVGPKIAVKTRRSWLPNILTRKLYSKGLARHVQVRVSTRVLRTIDKVGGLDEYLLGEKDGRVKGLGESGWWLRWAIMQTAPIQARFAAERARLGLPPATDVDVEAEEPVATAIDEVSELEVEEDSEAVPMDDAFTILPSAEETTIAASSIHALPRKSALRFRVGPNKHLILTPNGWRRTRPATNHAVVAQNLKQTKTMLKELLPEREAQLKQLLRQSARDSGVGRLSEEEIAQALKEARREWKREVAGTVEEKWTAHVAFREGKKAERGERRREERRLGKEKVAEVVVAE